MTKRRLLAAQKAYRAAAQENLARFYDEGIHLEGTLREALDRLLPSSHLMAKTELSLRPFAIRPAYRYSEERTPWLLRVVFGRLR